MESKDKRTLKRSIFRNKKVIIFDMDGTLIDSVGVWNEVDKELIKKISNGLIDQVNIQQQRDEVLRKFSEAEDSYLEYCGFLKEKYKSHLSKEEVKKLRYEIAYHYLTQVVDFKPNTERLLKYLKQKGFILVIATTTSKANMEKYMTLNQNMMRKVDFNKMFTLIYGRDAVKEIKPNPAVHYLVMNTLNVEPSDCLIVEDSLIGLEAAEKAGIDTIIIYDRYSDNDREELNKRACASYENYDELLSYAISELDY